MAQEEMAAAQSEKDAEMKEVQDYLAYMDQRNEAYLASVGLSESAQPEPELQQIRMDIPDDRAASTVAGGRYQPGPMPTETFDNA